MKKPEKLRLLQTFKVQPAFFHKVCTFGTFQASGTSEAKGRWHHNVIGHQNLIRYHNVIEHHKVIPAAGMSAMTVLWCRVTLLRVNSIFVRQLSEYAFMRKCRNCVARFLRAHQESYVHGLSDSLLCPLISVISATSSMASFFSHLGYPPGLGLSIQPEYNPGSTCYIVGCEPTAHESLPEGPRSSGAKEASAGVEVPRTSIFRGRCYTPASWLYSHSGLKSACTPMEYSTPG